MITAFSTASGSLYELDRDALRIRRLHGTHAPTPRQGEDAQWKSYISASRPMIGRPVLIVWAFEGDIAKLTVTTPVVAISTAN